MAIQFQNQKPAELFPVKADKILNLQADGDAFLDEKAKDIEEMTKKILAGGDVNIDGTVEDAESLALRFAKHFAEEQFDSSEDDTLAEVLWQSSRYLTDNKKPANMQITLEQLSKIKLPWPEHTGRIVQFVPEDCILAAKALIADWTNPAEQAAFAANLGAYLEQKVPARIIVVKDESAWNLFIDELKNFRLLAGSNIDVDTGLCLDTLEKEKLEDISSGYLLRLAGAILDPSDETNAPFSFARIVENAIRACLAKEEFFEVNAMLAETFFMTNICFVNATKVAAASKEAFAKSLLKQINGFNKGKKLKVVSKKSLKKAEKVDRMTQKSAGKPMVTKDNTVLRGARRKFSGKPATSKELLKMMTKVIENRTSSKMTSNTFKNIKSTFMRPNRRNPNDPNLMGKTTDTKYRPDIHIYLDTSGSISEPEFRDATVNLIALAKKMNVNLFISSFSHIISDTSKLEVQGKSIRQIYKDFQKIDKVSGGTNFELVWDKVRILDRINKKNNKSYQINFMVTDFEFWPSGRRTFSPEMPEVKNMFYVPVSWSGAYDHERMVRSAETFAETMMKLGDTGIKNRILIP